jgi:hypothetical protein
MGIFDVLVGIAIVTNTTIQAVWFYTTVLKSNNEKENHAV